MDPLNLSSADSNARLSSPNNVLKTDESANSSNESNAIVEIEENFSLRWKEFEGNLIR
jgi:hypothetical protein